MAISAEARAAAPALPQYHLPKHVYACSLAGGMVFLDLRRNRYFCLSEPDAAAVQPAIANYQASKPYRSSSSHPEQVATRLRQAGLLQSQDPGERAWMWRGHNHDALSSIDDRHLGRCTSYRYAFRFARSCLWARLNLRTKCLLAIAEDLERLRGHRCGTCDPERTAHLVDVFRRMRPFAFTSLDQCLFHALALARFVNDSGQLATWVIGVRLRPWGAHSWVQQGHCVLDTTPEIVREYAPILAV